MIVPGSRRRAPHVPHALFTLALVTGTISTTLLAWALIGPSNAGRDVSFSGPDISGIRSVAYVVPGSQFDDVVVRPVTEGAAARVIASFPTSGLTNFHARGKASPHGDAIAVLWLPPFATRANLSIVDLSSGQTRQAEGTFNLLAEPAWAPNGETVAVTTAVEVDGIRRTTVFRLNTTTLTSRPVATFEDVLDAVPVGFSFDSTRLFIVVVDQRGSNLFAESGGEVESVAELSPGRTRDWALSPDGARLAFVDVLGAGSRTYVGRTLLLATGAVTTLPSDKNQIGAAWSPGSPSPEFGGPGGSWHLTGPGAEDAFLIPRGWSPDGQSMVAVVAGVKSEGPQVSSLELFEARTSSSESRRVLISDAVGAAFLGWVTDPN